MKLKDKIKTKLVQLIGLDKIYEHVLSEIKRLDSADNKIHSEMVQERFRINRAYIDLNLNREDINILQNTIRNVVSVGSDIRHGQDHDRSWAVVCIEGNYNVVKFIDMHGADYRYILDFLKQFEGSRMVIDAPNPGYFENIFKMK